MPFRKEHSLLQDGEMAEEAFARHLPSNRNCVVYHEKLQKILASRSRFKEINDIRQAVVEEAVEHEGDPQVQGEVINAMQNVCDLNANSSHSLNDRESMFNGDQKRVYDSVKDHLLHQQQHETGACQCIDFKPLCKFVSGVGGTGKSFLIETITLLVRSMWPNKHQTCAIAASTGLAFNVGGITIHRLFQLPIEHDSRTASYWKGETESDERQSLRC